MAFFASILEFFSHDETKNPVTKCLTEGLISDRNSFLLLTPSQCFFLNWILASSRCQFDKTRLYEKLWLSSSHFLFTEISYAVPSKTKKGLLTWCRETVWSEWQEGRLLREVNTQEEYFSLILLRIVKIS